MSTISTSEEPGARLQEALTSWATHLAPAEIQDRRYQAAFEAIDCALVATISTWKAAELVNLWIRTTSGS